MVFQSLLPAGLAVAKDAGFDVSAFMCGPDGAQASPEAQAHFNDLMDLIGADVPAGAPPETCAKCVMSPAAVLPILNSYAAPVIYVPRETPYIRNINVTVISARGPPLGGRAPPALS